MIKKRIILALTFKDGVLFRTKKSSSQTIDILKIL